MKTRSEINARRKELRGRKGLCEDIARWQRFSFLNYDDFRVERDMGNITRANHCLKSTAFVSKMARSLMNIWDGKMTKFFEGIEK